MHPWAAEGRSALSGILFEMKTWMRFILPGRYVAPYYPTPDAVVSRMLRLAAVGPTDTVLDLGCGDGRVLTAAARLGARGIGYELDPQLAAQARIAISSDPRVSALITIEQGDAHKARAEHVSAATVIALYLSDSGNLRLLNALGGSVRPGTRVVSFCFSVDGWERNLVKRDDEDNLPIYLYRVKDVGTKHSS